MKRPAFQFYPADWQKDAELQSCSIAARGLWIEMMCILHQCTPYGYLVVNGKSMGAEKLARLVGEPPAVVRRLLSELEVAGVFSRDEHGCIYSRRMVKDERIRNVRSEAGRLGGNPDLLKHKDKQPDNHADNQRPTPSSSSSSSSSNTLSTPPGVEAPVGAPAEVPDCPHERIVELYHEVLPTNPRMLEWNETRRGYLRARWKQKALPNGRTQGYTTIEDGLAFWRRFFEWCAQSKFLTGQSDGRPGKPPFVADLEWLMRPTNFAKVIEGKYHER